MESEDMYFGKPIPHFPEYYITPEGKVYNSHTGREMKLSPTEHGELTVGFMKDGNQYRRSVKVLVAEAFVPGKTSIFDTPIQLDGDRSNLFASNIDWRPRWFAWKYVQQFAEPYPDWYADGPIVDVIHTIRYHTIFEAAITQGLLCKDIYDSIHVGNRVFPTGQKFYYI